MIKTCSDFAHIKNDRTKFGCCDSCHDDADGGWAELPEIEYLESLKSKGYEVNYINVIRPLNNGGMFDMDGETSKTILWCEYNNLFSVRILNASSVEELIKTTNLVIQDLKL
mgnify:CR=1 FL=1